MTQNVVQLGLFLCGQDCLWVVNQQCIFQVKVKRARVQVVAREQVDVFIYPNAFEVEAVTRFFP
jgi:hypothetical protein